MKAWRRLTFFIFACALAIACYVNDANATATLTRQQRAQGITVEDLAAAKKKTVTLNETVARGRESRFRFDGMLNYGIRQDVAQTQAEPTSMHRAMAVFSMTVLDRKAVVGFDDDLANELMTISLSAAAQFTMIGQEIAGSKVGNKPVELGDFDVAASRGIELDKFAGANSALDLSLGSTMPTSEASRYEGVSAVPYGSVGWNLAFRGGMYGFNQSVSADYTFNTFDFSPVTREINSDSSAGYTVAASARLGAGFRFTAGGTARAVHHLDGSVTDALSNFQVLSWTRSFATITLRHSNGSRAEDHQSSLWFVDQYRRVVSLSASVRF